MWMEAVAVGDLPVGGTKRVEFGKTAVLVIHAPGGWHAMADRCPHQEQSMVDGDVGERTIECPWHSVVVDLASGAVRNDMGFLGLEPVTVYRCEVRGDRLWIDVPA